MKWSVDFEDRAVGAAFSTDGKLLFVGTSSEAVQVLEAETGAPAGQIHGSSWGNSVRVSPDGRHLLTGGEDGILTVYALTGSTGQKVWEHKGHENWVAGLAWTPDSTRFATAGHDSSIRVWKPGTTSPLAELEDHMGSVRALAFSPSGDRLASGGYDQSLRLWDVAKGALDGDPTPCDAQVRGLAFSPDGRTLFVGEASHRIVSLPLAGAPKPKAFSGSAERLTCLCASPDGKALFTAGEDGKVHRWSTAKRAYDGSLAQLDGEVGQVQVNGAGTLLACCAERRLVVLAL
jgi:WD40 repeat protein